MQESEPSTSIRDLPSSLTTLSDIFEYGFFTGAVQHGSGGGRLQTNGEAGRHQGPALPRGGGGGAPTHGMQGRGVTEATWATGGPLGPGEVLGGGAAGGFRAPEQ